MNELEIKIWNQGPSKSHCRNLCQSVLEYTVALLKSTNLDDEKPLEKCSSSYNEE